jgi:molybdopterin converting factor small subunit
VVILNFKLSPLGRVDLNLTAPLSLTDLLTRAADQNGVKIGGTMVVRRGRLLGLDELIYDGDELEIYPALSGG